MVKLFCAIVGAARSAFGVKIANTESVYALKKVIKGANPKELKNVDAADLQLFLAKTEEGGWLSYDDDLKKKLLQNYVDTSKLKELSPTWKLNKDKNPKLFDQDVPLEEDVVHVLVKVPAPFPQWLSAPGQFPPLVFDDEDPVISIPAAYVANSGLTARDDGLVLYLRNGVQEEWNALLASVVETYAQLWIVGPMGTGKSLAAFAFACKLQRVDGDLGGDWDVLWISCPKGFGNLLDCILFRGEDKKLTCSIHAKDLEKLLETLPDHTMLFLDGFVNQPDFNYTASVTTCVDWRSQNKPFRRLVIVTSMVSLGKHWKYGLFPKIPSTDVYDEVCFKMYSWTLSEYQEALKHDKLFTHVKKMFDVDVDSSVSPNRRDELAEVKYYVAGGSAQLMFDLSTDEAETALTDALSWTDDALKFVKGAIGLEYPEMVKRLFALYPPGRGRYDAPQCRFVSSFVAKKMSLRVVPERLQTLAYTLPVNSALEGQMLEMWFFSCLTYEGVQCYKLEGSSICEAEKWPISDVNTFDPESNDAINLVKPQKWFEPLKWHNAGFDAVFVDYQDVADTDTSAKLAGYSNKLHVRFVQVTRFEKHSFKTECFKHLLSRFKAHMGNSLWISRVEVSFVVPLSNMKVFSIPVNEEDFRRDVVDPVTRSNGVPGTIPTRARFTEVRTDVSIDVVGLTYDLFETTGDKRKRRWYDEWS